MTHEELLERGFCTCLQRARGPRHEPTTESSCAVHPEGEDHPDDYRLGHGLVFYDDRRDRYVTWPDAVEAMRQGRYAGADNMDLIMFTWFNLLELLATLREPLTPAVRPATEEEADDLIAWAGEHLGHHELRWLLVFARGGGSPALCNLFRFMAVRAES
jgi:hypothetical protein